MPGPGEPGHETWPQDSDAWTRGGAGIWQTPAIDPELGLIYFTTGNPGPDLNGGVRKGDNLYSVSVVALDAKTGKYRWHFQQVHHDIWDYDSPNPVVLFDAPYEGKMRKGLVEVSKTGWAYILDRETGKPLIGIEEKPVPQEPRQATAPTQPFPIGDAIVPQQVDIVPEGVRIDANGNVPNNGRIFTPFWTDPITVKPGTMGGANWPPSSYDPESHLLYVCATDRISTFWVREPLETPGPNKVYMGGAFGQADVDDAGVFAAVDVRTNQARVAPAMARDLLQRFGRHRRRPGVRRPRGRAPHCARQAQRRKALGVHDGRGRELHRHDVRAQGEAVRRRACGRRCVRERQAGRWDLDVLARRHDGSRTSAASRGACGARGRQRACRSSGRRCARLARRSIVPTARRSTKPRASHATVKPAPAATAVGRPSSPARMRTRSSPSRRAARTTCRRSPRRIRSTTCGMSRTTSPERWRASPNPH